MNVPPHELNCYNMYSEDAIKDQSRNNIVQSEEVKILKYLVEKINHHYLSFYYIVERRGFYRSAPPPAVIIVDWVTFVQCQRTDCASMLQQQRENKEILQQ